MSHTGRPPGRLLYLAFSVLFGAATAIPQTPALTTISDTVFRADGSFAAGTLVMSWPALPRT